MHELLWIDTGPLISLHRQLPRSGVEPVAATAAAQIRGQRETERAAHTTRIANTEAVAARAGPPFSVRHTLSHTISSKQHFYVVSLLYAFPKHDSLLAKQVLAGVQA